MKRLRFVGCILSPLAMLGCILNKIWHKKMQDRDRAPGMAASTPQAAEVF
jgi:hypothetical protein